VTALVEPEYVAELPMGLIDLPQLDARLDRDEDELRALGQDIKMNGLIEPLKLVRQGARYELVDGTSRFMAMEKVGCVVTRAFIYPTQELALEGMKYRANAFRIAMSVADEAVYFNQLFETECGRDLTKVAALVNKSENYVGDRINLLAGDEAVFAALRAKKISIGVAQILNKIDRENYRRYYLEFAVRDGVTRSTAERWHAEYKAAIGDVPTDLQRPVEPSTIVPAGVLDVHHCYVCGKSDPRYLPEQIPVHTHCRLALLDPLLASAHGQE
jgi:ParB/RepB/Spo0J family partition protein